MTEQSAIASASVLERLVLYEFAALDDGGRTPVQAPALVRQCRDRLATLDDVVGSRCSEADVARCCRSLDDSGLLTRVDLDAAPAAGMGRPAYELAVDTAVVRELLDDERFRERRTDKPAP